jgi:signal transduction histidine kinase
MLSLRGRVLIGAALWTVGLTVFAMAGLAQIFRYYPDMPFLGRDGAIHRWVFHAAPVFCAAFLFMVAGVVQVRSGLAGIARLRTRLNAVHDGREVRIEGRYVSEVQPLVDDLNALLDSREQAVRRAVAKAGDLAHGLKTPLAILTGESERAEAAGQGELAAAITQQVDRMRRQIDYHLAHARAAASGAAPGARCLVSESADGLARALRRLHADRALAIDVRVPPSHAVRVQREDLDEMLGNLLDNACKWTARHVVIESIDSDEQVVIMVDDDGPGVPAEMRPIVLQRGVRADVQAPGFGLGLAIVQEMAEVYRGSIALDDSPIGGLRARLRLPRA